MCDQEVPVVSSSNLEPTPVQAPPPAPPAPKPLQTPPVAVKSVVVKSAQPPAPEVVVTPPEPPTPKKVVRRIPPKRHVSTRDVGTSTMLITAQSPEVKRRVLKLKDMRYRVVVTTNPVYRFVQYMG